MGSPVSQGGFHTQGSLSLVDLVAKPVQYTVGVLARLSAQGVDPYTLHVAHFIAGKFQIGPNRSRRIQAILSSLKCFSGYGKVLWFGFGVQSLVQILARSDQGRLWIALSSALSECYHEDLAAEILHEMVLTLKPEGHLTPSVGEWLMIVKAFQGVVLASDFPVLAERLMSLDRTVEIQLGKQPNRGCSAPADIAAALMETGRISKNELQTITVVGGPDGGVLAALAEWLLDLNVTIIDKEGTVIYSTCETGQTHVHVILDRTETAGSHALKISSKTYFLSDASHLLHDTSVGNNKQWSMVSGRLDWNVYLSEAFGPDFKQLILHSYAFGTALGCTAKILDSVGQRENPDGRATLQFSNFNAAAGAGFVSNLIYWFPELAQVRSEIQEGSRLSIEKAKSTYEVMVSRLKSTCRCDTCQPDPEVATPTCVVTVLETILIIGMSLASTTVEPGIRPTRSDFEAFYRRRHNARYGQGSQIQRSPLIFIEQQLPFPNMFVSDSQVQPPRIAMLCSSSQAVQYSWNL